MSSPAFQFYPKQWLGDDKVLLMDWDARGMHVHLMCIAWQQQPVCTLPDDDEILCKWCGDPTDWDRLKKQIFRAWDMEGGRWVQRGLLREYEKQQDFRKTRSENAKARWNKKDAAAAVPKGTDQVDARALQVQCSSSSSSTTVNNTTLPPHANDRRQQVRDPSIPGLTDIRLIPTKQSEWVVFFQRQGFDLWEIKKHTDVLAAFDEWILKKVSTELVLAAMEEVHTKKGRVSISYYLHKVDDYIYRRDHPQERKARTRASPRKEKFDGLAYVNRNRRQPDGQHDGSNYIDGEYYPVEPAGQ